MKAAMSDSSKRSSAKGSTSSSDFPGESVIPLYDALYDFDINHILTRHEQGAVHAADGYARASGKVGVCLATSGPGATNLVTRHRQRLHGQRAHGGHHRPGEPAPHRHRRLPGGRHHRHHAADRQAQLPGARSRPTSRASSRRPSTSPAPGRPGPVVIDIPVDVNQGGHRVRPGRRAQHDRPARLQAHAQGASQADPRGRARHRRGRAPGDLRRRRGDHLGERLGRAARTGAVRPHPGHNYADGQRLLPRGPRALLGMVGMHGTPYANYALSQCRPDLRGGRALRRPGDRQAREPSPRTPPSSTSTSTRPRSPRTWPSTSPSWATPSGCSPRLVAELKKLELSPDRHLPWMEQVADWKRDHPLLVREEPENGEIMPECGHQQDLGGHQGRGHRLHRGGPAPDVGGPVLPVPPPAPVHQLRRPGHHGLRLPGGHRGAGRPPGQAGDRHRRRRLVPDDLQELATAVQVRAAGEGLHPQQPVPGHGAPVAGALLEPALQRTPASSASPTSSSWPRRTGRRATGSPGPRTSKRCCASPSAATGPAVIDIRVKREANVYPMIPAGGIDPRHDGAWTHEAHAVGPGREQAGRPDPGGGAVRAARVQHRQPGGRRDRGSRSSRA